jgi:hypothetical protein
MPYLDQYWHEFCFIIRRISPKSKLIDVVYNSIYVVVGEWVRYFGLQINCYIG